MESISLVALLLGKRLSEDKKKMFDIPKTYLDHRGAKMSEPLQSSCMVLAQTGQFHGQGD